MTKRALLKNQKVFVNLFNEKEKQVENIEPLFDSSNQLQTMMWIKISDIRPNPHQPRSNFDPEKLRELSDSIREKGLLQAITVRLRSGYFEIIAGERRYRACKMLGMREIPAMIRNDIDDLGTLEIALIENLQREDLTPVEEASIYARMLKELNYTQDQLSKTLSKSQQYINDRLQLLNLSPEVQVNIQEGKLSLSKARKIATIKDTKLQEEITSKVMRDGLNARQTEQLVKITKGKTSQTVSHESNKVHAQFSQLVGKIVKTLEPLKLQQLDDNEKEKLKKILEKSIRQLTCIYNDLH